MKRKLIHKLLFLAMSFMLVLTLFPVTAMAYTDELFEDNGLTFRVLSEDSTTLTGAVWVVDNSSCSGAYVVPKTVVHNNITYIITGIGSDAFRSNTGITEITIPVGVTLIGLNAFRDCTSLTKVTFEAGSQLTNITSGAFTNSGLDRITIPTGVTGIGQAAFGGCKSLSTVTFEAGSQLTNIGIGAFQNSGLNNISIPAGVTGIGHIAFTGCKSLTTVTFESGSQLTGIGIGAFQNSGLNNISIPAGVISIGQDTFGNCTGLTTVTFEAGSQLTNIGIGAFQNSGLNSIAIPAGVTGIGQAAFNNCKSLSMVTFETGSQLTGIGEAAFQNSGLESIAIPTGVTSIGPAAFSSCGNLTTVTFEAGSQLTSIGQAAFLNSGLKSIVIPAEVTGIGDFAFTNSKNLVSVTFSGNTPPTIGADAFAYTASSLAFTVLPGTIGVYQAALPAGADVMDGTGSISNVTISPAAVTVVKGNTQSFSATVSGTGSYSHAVTWSVTGGGLGTSIDSNGVLMVSPDEASTHLSVTAISFASPTQKDIVQVTVIAQDRTRPTISAVTPNGTDVSQNGNIVITFSEAIDITTAGTVSLNSSASLTGGSWSADAKTYIIPYSGLSYSTEYTVSISGFKDMAGNTMTADSTHSFTVNAAPVANIDASISPTSVNYDLNSPADVVTTITWNSASTVTDVVYGTTSLTTPDVYVVSGSALTIKSSYLNTLGISTGDVVTFKISFDKGASVTLTASIVDSYIPATNYNVIVQNNGNGTVSTNVYSASKGTEITLTATPDRGYRFREWQVVDGGVMITDNKFTMPDNNVTVKAIFEQIPLTAYQVSVNGSYAAASGAGSHYLGNIVTVNAGSRSNYTFSGWTSIDGITFANANSTTTTFTMPAGNVTVTASWSFSGGSGSGNTGSNDNNTTDDADSTKEQQQTKPDQPTIGAASVKAKKGTDSFATVEIPEKIVATVISKAQAEVTAQKKSENGVGVSLTVNSPAGTKSLGIVLTQPVLIQLSKAGVSQFEVDSGLGTLNFNLEAIKKIQKQSTGNVTISITPVTGLNGDAKTLVGTRPIYNISISYVKEGKTVYITSLGSGSVILSISYTPSKKEAAGYLFGVYVDNKGNATRIEDSAYDANSKSIIFNSNHFSLYGVGYTAPKEKFKDISSHWAKASIDYVVGRGLFSGTSSTTFSPDEAMSCGMLVTALGRLAGVDVSDYKTVSFTDVAADQYYAPYIEWAYKKGVVSGIGNNQFAPERAITHEEIALILRNYAKATGYTLPVTREAAAFADDSGIGSTYKEAVKVMQQAGIMMGGDGNKLNPEANATRAEVSAILHRYIKLTIDPATAQG